MFMCRQSRVPSLDMSSVCKRRPRMRGGGLQVNSRGVGVTQCRVDRVFDLTHESPPVELRSMASDHVAAEGNLVGSPDCILDRFARLRFEQDTGDPIKYGFFGAAAAERDDRASAR